MRNLTVEFIIPEFTDVFSPTGIGVGAKAIVAILALV
jgi:hypothetical protein